MNSNQQHTPSNRPTSSTKVVFEDSLITLSEFLHKMSKVDEMTKLVMLTKLFKYNPQLQRAHGVTAQQPARRGGRRNKGTNYPPPAPPPTPALPQQQTFTHVPGFATIHSTQFPGFQSVTGVKSMDPQTHFYYGPLYFNRSTGTTYSVTSSMGMAQQQYNSSLNNTSWTAPSLTTPPQQLAADEKVIIYPETATPRGPKEGRTGELRLKFYVGGQVELNKSDKSVPDTSIIPSIEDSGESSEIDLASASLPSPDIKEANPAPLPMVPHLATPHAPQPKRSIKLSVNNINNKSRSSEEVKQPVGRNNTNVNQVRFTNNRSKVVPIPVKPKITTLQYPVQSVPFITSQQSPLEDILQQSYRNFPTLYSTQVTDENRMGQALRDVHLVSGTPRVIVAPNLVTDSTPMRFIDVHSGATSIPIDTEQESFGLKMSTVPVTSLAPEPKMVTVMPVQISDEPDDYKPAESVDWEELNSVPLTDGYWPLHLSTRVAISPLSMLKRNSYQKKTRHSNIVGKTRMSRMSLFRGLKRSHSVVESSEESVDPNEYFHETKRRRLMDSESIDEPATALLDLTLSSQRSQYQAEHVASPEYHAPSPNFNSHENDNDVPEDEPLVTKRKAKIKLVPKVTAEQATILLDSKDEEEDNDRSNTNRYSAIEEQEVASPPVIAPSMEASDPTEIQSIEMDAPMSQSVAVMTEPKDEEVEAAKRAKEEQDAQETTTDNSTSDKSQVDNEAFVKMLVGFIDIEDKIKAKQEELNGMFAEFEKKRGQIEQALDPALRNQILRSIRALAEEQKK